VEASDEVRMVDWSLSRLRHRYLAQLADLYMLALPEFSMTNGSWRRTEYGVWVLSATSQEELLARIREEKRIRGESWNRWVQTLIPPLSLIVAILALIKSERWHTTSVGAVPTQSVGAVPTQAGVW
jgi:hypothetical protein